MRFVHAKVAFSSPQGATAERAFLRECWSAYSSTALRCHILVGKPLLAIQMTQRDIWASLYAPLRVLLNESEDGKTVLEYDWPSSFFGQFGDDRVTLTATMIDRKLEALVAAAVG